MEQPTRQREWGASITVRLAVLYSMSTLVILLSISIALYWVLTRNLLQDESIALSREVTELATLLQNREANQTLIAMEVDPPQRQPDSGETPTTYLRIQTANGDVLFETSGMQRYLPHDAFPEPAAFEAEWRAMQWAGPDGTPYLLASAFGPLEAGGAPTVIHAAMDVSSDEVLMANYRRSMTVLLVVAALLSSAIAVAVTRRGIRPLEDIAAVIGRVGLDRLDERVQPSRWPRELRELARAFDHMLERLEVSVRHLKWFSADVAHELRTPVNVLMGEAEVALSSSRTEAEYREVLESTLEECQRLARLVDNLLFLARAENAQTPVQSASIDCQHELTRIVSFFEAAASEQDVALVVEGQARIHADPTLFRRAVNNLVSNALQHTPPGGRITVAAAHVADGSSVITVTDTGSGIALADKERIFDRFYRGNGATRQEFGYGIGLAIVKSIMTLHAGSIVLESEPGAGTTARLHFPVEGAPDERSAR